MGSPRMIRLEYVLVLYVGLYGHVEIILSLTSKRIHIFFAGYSTGCTEFILPPPGGSAGAYGYWM
jgi:hypothetical protein